MSDTSLIEKEQRRDYPGLAVRRDRGAVVVHVPVRYHRRNGRQMLLTPEDHQWKPEQTANQTLVEATAKAHRWQACPAIAGRRRRKQTQSGEYASTDDLAQALGVDRTYVGRVLRLTSLAPDVIEAILRGEEPEGTSLRTLQKGLPVGWREQRERWYRRG